MGVAAYNRGSKAIREQIDRESAERKETSYVLRLEQEVDNQAEAIAKLQTELQSAQAELERARKAYRLRCSIIEVLREEKRELQAQKDRRIEFLTMLLKKFRAALADSEHGHLKLTRVMKLALTPEQYQRYREEAREIYGE